jgi:uncharacterized protein YjbI with pentapeptide repeats
MANSPNSSDSQSAAADAFENEMPTGNPPNTFPIGRGAWANGGGSATGRAAGGAVNAMGSQPTGAPNRIERFTVDYNPDPDQQSDNEDPDHHLSAGAFWGMGGNGRQDLAQGNVVQGNNVGQGNGADPYANVNAGGGSVNALPGGESGTPQGLPPVDAAGNPLERYRRQPTIDPMRVAQAPISVIAIAGALIVIIGFTLGSLWLTLFGSVVAFAVSLKLIAPTLEEALNDLSQQQQALFIAIPGLFLGLLGLIYTSGIFRPVARWGSGLRWDVVSALGDFLGAIGQILIAIIAVYVAWRQYIISRDLTLQQNLITQQQTIDSFFQGVSELVLDDEGLLEDWPQERIIAEARTAAILSSVDAAGKAKVLRFLSRSKLLTPLARDQRLGRPILDGIGGYAEDRLNGTRVIDLGVMLAAANLAKTDLRWLDLSEANLIRADLTDCDLVRTNLARAILCDANFTNTDMMGVRLFYGDLETATPRTRQDQPNYSTGEFTGAVVEGMDLTNVQRISEVQRCYCCAWGGSKTRGTVPGGCDGIPNRLGR